jgi:hypothetical protein
MARRWKNLCRLDILTAWIVTPAVGFEFDTTEDQHNRSGPDILAHLALFLLAIIVLSTP